MFVDPSGNLLIADRNNQRIRKVDLKTGIIDTVAGKGVMAFGGDGRSAIEAGFWFPAGVVTDATGNIFIADGNNFRVRRVDSETGIITTIAGVTMAESVQGSDTAPGAPWGIAVDTFGNVFFSDMDWTRVWRIDAQTGITTPVASNGDLDPGFSGDGGPAIEARLARPRAIAVDASGNIFIADSKNNRVRRVDSQSRVITTVAGGGTLGQGDGDPATRAQLSDPWGLAVDGAGNLFVAENEGHRIRRVDIKTGIITTVAGGGSDGIGYGGPATSARLFTPVGLAIDTEGNLYIAEAGGLVRKVSAIAVPLDALPL